MTFVPHTALLFFPAMIALLEMGRRLRRWRVEYPRRGLIRLQSLDRTLISLRDSMK